IKAKGSLLCAAQQCGAMEVGSGLSARIEDSMNLDRTVTFVAGACQTSTSGRILCRDTSRLLRASFSPARVARGYLFNLNFRGLGIQGPYEPDVTLTITDGTGDHVGVVPASACTVNATQMVCRQAEAR